MPNICPQCGALLSDDMDCQKIFNSLLGLEFSQPEYGTVHMLTVACFMIQHDRYSAAAFRWIAQQLHAYLEDKIPVNQLREKAARTASQPNRTWKILRQPDEPPSPKTPWSMTIADVAANYYDAQSYCDLVRQWARITLQEMKVENI